MDHLLGILTKPDNVPIVLMLALIIFYTTYSFRKARRNDRREGSEEADLGDKVQVWLDPHAIHLFDGASEARL